MLSLSKYIQGTAGLTAAALLITTTACRQLPGTDEQQGAVLGGVGGAIAGAAIGGEENRLLGAILGGALGAGGGYVIGANADRITGKDRDSARRAVEKAQSNPATTQQALNSTSADINNDGFVTMDEVIALEKANLSDQEIIERLNTTDQVFDLTNEQRRYLREQGVSENVIDAMLDVNRETRDRLLSNSPASDDVIGRPRL